MLSTSYLISGECLRKFRYLNLSNLRRNSNDKNQVIKEIASKIIETKRDKSPVPTLKMKVDIQSFKEIASKIITTGDDSLEKKFESSNNPTEIAKKILCDYPEPPTTCCMSACSNCVWLDYAEKLSRYFKNGDDKAIKEIQERITDESLKAFLLHELRMRNKT